jgi:hypothetical protein
MKKILFLFGILFVEIFICCKSSKSSIYPTTIVRADTILATKDYLMNRIPDCDMAIAHMDSIFTPVSLMYDEKIPDIKLPSRFGNVKIVNNIFLDDDLFSKQQYLYYINLDCFENKPTSTIFKMFCPKEAFENLKKIDSMYQAANKRWHLTFSISNLKNSEFGVTFSFENGKVRETYSNKTVYIRY